MKIDWMVVAYNVLLLIASVGIGFFAIQHAMFFYSFPPKLSNYVEVPFVTYMVIGFFIYLLLKYSHFVEERGEMFKDDEG